MKKVKQNQNGMFVFPKYCIGEVVFLFCFIFPKCFVFPKYCIVRTNLPKYENEKGKTKSKWNVCVS